MVAPPQGGATLGEADGQAEEMVAGLGTSDLRAFGRGIAAGMMTETDSGDLGLGLEAVEGGAGRGAKGFALLDRARSRLAADPARRYDHVMAEIRSRLSAEAAAPTLDGDAVVSFFKKHTTIAASRREALMLVLVSHVVKGVETNNRAATLGALGTLLQFVESVHRPGARLHLSWLAAGQRPLDLETWRTKTSSVAGADALELAEGKLGLLSEPQWLHALAAYGSDLERLSKAMAPAAAGPK